MFWLRNKKINFLVGTLTKVQYRCMLFVLGVLGVVGSFGYGMMYGLAKGTTKGNIRGMTGRVSFQALAIAAIMGDIWWDTKNRKKMMAAAAAAKKT